MTPEEYLALPEEKPYLEYVDGMVLQKPMPSFDHGALILQIGYFFKLWMMENGGGAGADVRTRLVELPNYRLPDVSFFAPGVGTGRDAVPTLAVEIRSPDQTMAELRRKCRFFRENGVEACWLIDPRSRTAEVFEGDRDAEQLVRDGVLTAACMPGFSLPLPELFAILGDDDE
jgi:Uma2 family endonuclease